MLSFVRVPAAVAALLLAPALVAQAPAPAAPRSDSAARAAAARARPAEPFAFADFTWLTGNPRTTENAVETAAFTGEFRFDVSYIAQNHDPADHTLVGTTASGRTGEVQLQQLGLGGDFHVGNVRGRVMTQFGLYSTMTPRNDASTGRGQWQLDNAYRYLSEAYGGYHFDVAHGMNVDAGIFMSYIGLFSYYNFDNWAYQASYVSSNTPWFFNGIRLQYFPTEHLKIEPWLVNGWQSYGMFNSAPGVGVQFLWRPTGSLSFVSNNYYGKDWLGLDRTRLHSDNSVQVKYHEDPANFVSRAAFTFTFDLGCEWGAGVSCRGDGADPAQNFAGWMAYHRAWLAHDRFALTVGGGMINNPGRYLVLMPPINGATAVSGTPYFTYNPGDPFSA
ncbi:MAG: outer membrane beta-barrel protein, partial [Gemmatimonadetes bacterium]|nr:outer membrane beta-barrel protein [Gemmatimonadota bacterium]